MAYHDDLLEQAHVLATLDQRGHPKQVNLRRAVSSAYYGIFHLLISEAVLYWRLERHRDTFSRMFEHAKIRGACSRYDGSNVDLTAVALSFRELQQYRNIADYDNATVWTRSEVRKHIKMAQDAFAAWNRARRTSAAQDFLLTLFVQERK